MLLLLVLAGAASLAAADSKPDGQYAPYAPAAAPYAPVPTPYAPAAAAPYVPAVAAPKPYTPVVAAAPYCANGG